MAGINHPGLKEEKTEGIEGFGSKVKELVAANPKERIFLLFTGNDEAESGGSWCPDCRNLEARLPTIVNSVKPSGILLRVLVGDRPTWKDPACPFRTEKKLHLTSIPTLLEWGTPRRLSNADVENDKNVEMFFRSDDDQ